MSDSGVTTLEDDKLLDDARRLEQEGRTNLVGGVITLFAGLSLN